MDRGAWWATVHGVATWSLLKLMFIESMMPSSHLILCHPLLLLPSIFPTQITITGLEPRVQLDVAGRSENFLVDTGATYSVLISYSGAFSSQICTILGATGQDQMAR